MAKSKRSFKRALWVECEGSNDTLTSKKKIQELIQQASDNRFNLIYVQLFRGHRAWYKSQLVSTTPYQNFLKKEQIDLLAFLIQEAHQKGIEVHGWMNLLRVVRNSKNHYPVIEKLGTEIVTRNGRGISLWDYPKEKLPDGGYWLDPGDPKVQRFLGDVAVELIQNYPQLDGLHLDFVRIPFNVPYPGSKWDGGMGFGYGKKSVERFKAKTGLNAMKMEKTRENCQIWDDWRRDQVTEVVRTIQKRIKSVDSKKRLSAAVLCWLDRAYLSSFQDWTRWLDEGLIDVAVVMNYSIDSRLVKRLSRQALALKNRQEVYIGLGAYLLNEKPQLFEQQVEETLALKPEGVVFFSYDSMLKKPEMFQILKKGQKRKISKR